MGESAERSGLPGEVSVKIGPYTLDNPWILAPMAGVSEMPYRVIARQMGASAAPTELVSARGLLEGRARTERYTKHNSEVEQPFWLQIFGGDPEQMAAGAVRARELGAKIVDVNMGCPVKKVTKNSAGSALLKSPDRAASIVRAMHESSGLPVTVKIRAGWDDDSVNCVEVGQAVQEAGCAAIAIHPRTRKQGYTGKADWSLVKDLVDALSIPVIGNGDVYTPTDAHNMLAETGCQAVMIGRGALGNPWMFQYLTRPELPEPTPMERWAVARDHFEAHLGFIGVELAAVRRFRQHILWYAGGFDEDGSFRKEITAFDHPDDVKRCAESFFSRAERTKSAWSLPHCDTKGALG